MNHLLKKAPHFLLGLKKRLRALRDTFCHGAPPLHCDDMWPIYRIPSSLLQAHASTPTRSQKASVQRHGSYPYGKRHATAIEVLLH
jgi:hypothetical protein